MQTLSEFNKSRARRPYWVLLALALFFAGQIAVASHWHEATANTIDNDCALCVLSSTAGTAIVADAVKIVGIAFCVFFFVHSTRVFVSLRASFYQSRAPPL
ncbi:MAG: hypothetical protein QM709_07100 [Spongiibacteraceae bacterium]